MLGDDPPVLADYDAIGTGMNLNRAQVSSVPKNLN
jgi:hypothetical protein